MKKKLSSIALSTVMTGSLLLTPIANAEEINASKITVSENTQIVTQQEEQEVKNSGKEIVKEDSKEEVIQEKSPEIDMNVEENKSEALESKQEEIHTIIQEDTEKTDVNIVEFDKENKLGFLKGKLSSQKSTDIDGVIEFFKENKKLFKLNNPKEELKEITTKEDELGNTHVKVQQMYKNIPLFGKQYIIHFNKDGEIYAVNGKIDNTIYNKISDKDHQKLKIREKVAIEVAKSEVNTDALTKEPDVKSYFYEMDGKYLPVYEVRVLNLGSEPGDWSIFINANNGEVIKKYNRIHTVSAKGVGKGVLNDEKKLNLEYKNGAYYMIDNTKNGVSIKTYTAKHVPQDENIMQYFLPGLMMYSEKNEFFDEKYKPAVDAHKYAEHVYDYYNKKFGRNSIDDKGMDIISSVHYGDNYVNAFWFYDQMTYGDGDGSTSLALSGALDVVGHEMTHGVTENEANLVYENQSGALNESFSDVFGTFIEFEYQPDKADWLCGEDVWTPHKDGDALRDLEDPGSSKAYRPQPTHMREYVHTDRDHGGVHTNSGIPNKAAYLVTSEVGVHKAEKIYYKALTNYLTSTSNFHDARLALIQSAEDFYGEDSFESKAVANAFDSVGIK
ncbi:MAG: M4 family metallopeptidase [Tepidibacter sp.]|jgi:Zn-dependent metalloprotease|uniref:M4 family metallopeptidase n=1 Tax=Tepidibacter sp. TaxID=2529387 RepID=UPI0025E8CD09|nr:M4 family metallopeptidase [Tepidibacter sp.]MCT4509799.1 M4 family metallopeptidase [Tepidibacter sp.]